MAILRNRLRTIALSGGALFAALSPLPAAAENASAPAPAPAPQQAEKPMNVIFVLVDDLRFDAMGFLTPGLKTPNIDFLRKNGTYFPNAVVTSSLCSPSRATILTGQTARNHGVIDNHQSSEEGLIFFPQYLQQAGYRTGFFGKWHMGDDTDAPRPGFDRWVSFKGQGTYYPTDGISPEGIKEGQRQTLNVDGKHVNRKDYITTELTDYALDWLKEDKKDTQPFFLYLSHKAVHSDPEPAPEHKGEYADLDVTLPASAANTPENNAGKPLWVQNQRNSWHGIDFPYHTDEDFHDYVRRYFETLSSVDDSVGRILTYLHKNDLDKNTMVVFYSDNGYLFGDHGLIDKRNAYEPSVRVPMLVYAPGHVPANKTVDAVVRNLDLAPTFLDVAGVAEPSQMEGTSFLPLVTGQESATQWKSGDFVYEYYWEWSFPQTPTTFAIERDRVKYIQYHGVWDIEELYDLKKDPNEMHNLINDPAYLDNKIALRQALYEQLANSKGQHDIPYGERNSEGLVWRKKGGPRAADFPDRWYVEPDLPTKFNGYFPDSEAKLKADEEGKPYFPGSAQ
ncbi:sulfatase-like hydrolase/transferase [Altererythrobacter indicus]|uniref:Sulfatase-like hydrolase/transferase n=1 Tax=Altericroceibacterium indicum TaxID=374177 RepID=A0A845ACI0_9SPHN|nr:sulfatase [Altericroceibacterium indicum]MXP27099.1 sulfatase-like hydrolase/transferase [Altericroceibacterium indicum]